MPSLFFRVYTFSSLIVLCIYAYKRVDIHKMVKERARTTRSVYGGHQRLRSLEESDDQITIKDLLQLEPGEELQLERKMASSQGIYVEKLQETYRGIPVLHGVVTVETTSSGKLTGDASGTLIQEIDKDITDIEQQLLSEEQVLQLAIEEEKDESRRNDIGNIKIKKLIYPDENMKARLVYQVIYLLDKTPPKRPILLIDAKTGEIVLKFNSINKAQDECVSSSITGFGGNKKVGKIEYGKSPYCIKPLQICFLENEYVKVVNMNHSNLETNQSQQTISYNCDESPGDQEKGAYSPSLDAFFYGTSVAKMYEEWIGGSPLKDKIVIRVHYGSNLDDAMWNGQNVSLGDGDSMFYPLVSLNVVGHEIAHGVVEQNSNLYYYLQSAGINEAFADIMGKSAEAYLYGMDTKFNWYIGSSITKTLKYLRSFQNPEDDGSFMHVDNFTSNVSPHRASGPFRYAFYNLVAKQGVSFKDAFQTFDRANKLYWHQLSSYQQAACSVIKAAYDLGQNIVAYSVAFYVIGIQNCNINDHIVNVVVNRKYDGITVSNNSRPLFKFETPEWAANVSIVTQSLGDNVNIVVGNASNVSLAENNYYASDIGTLNIGVEGNEVIYIALHPVSLEMQHVTLSVKYSCDMTWSPTNVTDANALICLMYYYCDPGLFWRLSKCQKR